MTHTGTIFTDIKQERELRELEKESMRLGIELKRLELQQLKETE